MSNSHIADNVVSFAPQSGEGIPMAIADAIWARNLYDYDAETGTFTWRNPPPKARTRARVGTPAGTADSRSGSLLLRLGGKLHQASRIAWLYANGEWPERQVHFKDASLPLPARNRLDNLRLAGSVADLSAEKLREVLRYDPETGEFFWLVKRRGVKSGVPAGTIKPMADGRLRRYIRFEGVEYPGSRLAWLFYYGEWPKARIEFSDGDASNTRINNLAEGRFSHGTRQDHPLSQEERQGRRAATYRRKDLARSYGLTDEEREAMAEAQNHLCASCGQPQNAKHKGRVRRLAVDHDHSLGKCREAVRDLLCNACNGSMGSLKDDIEKMAKLLVYRARWARPGELPTILPQVAELLSMCTAANKVRVA